MAPACSRGHVRGTSAEVGLLAECGESYGDRYCFVFKNHSTAYPLTLLRRNEPDASTNFTHLLGCRDGNQGRRVQKGNILAAEKRAGLCRPAPMF
jgi:hypothetical protein